MPNPNSTEGNVDVTTSELQAQIAALKADISELTSTVTRFGKTQSDIFRNQARDGLRVVSARGTETYNAAHDYADQKLTETEDYIRTHPAAAVGIAAGVGFLVGLLSGRR